VIEVLAVVVIILVVAAFTIPNVLQMQRNNRLIGSAKGIAGQLALARMKASADFTLTRLSFALAGATYKLEVWNKTAAAFQLQQGDSDQPLAQGVKFGFGSISAPAGSQTTIAQSAQIVFDSRGIPIDAAGNPTPSSAIYIEGASSYCAVTVSLSGQIRVWRYDGSAWVAM
jgi:Tfp pilus assembly protein FimT